MRRDGRGRLKARTHTMHLKEEKDGDRKKVEEEEEEDGDREKVEEEQEKKRT